MHDFCFTYPYGIIVLVGGTVGFLRKGSTASLVAGATTGLLLLWAGYLSEQAYLNGSNSGFALFLETAIALALATMMGKRYIATGKVMPAGAVGGLSGIMALFYLYKVLTGGNDLLAKDL